MRMRQRRIDRLLLRAQIAHEAGRDDEAREALAEAEQLNGRGLNLLDLPAPPADPTEAPPDVAVVWSDTDVELNPPFEPQFQADAGSLAGSRTRAWTARVAGVLTVIVTLGFAAARVSDLSVVNQAGVGTQPAASREPTPAAPEPVAELPAVRLAVADVAASNPVQEPIAGAPEQQAISLAGRQIPPNQPTTSGLTSRPDYAALPAVGRVDDSPPASAPPALPTPVPLETTTPAAIPAAPPVASPSFSPSPRVSSPTSDPSPDASASPSRTAAAIDTANADADAAIRRALARYESAYSRLDAEAAGDVWPGLDRKALARAFDGLAAQSVSLGSCDVRLMGEIAMADCAGTATWTPKVGGGTRSQSRRWQFRFRNGANGWQIVGATVR